MSIEMENPETVLELVDAASNLVEQMSLAHMMSDENHFEKVHAQAAAFLFEARQKIQEEEG